MAATTSPITRLLDMGANEAPRAQAISDALAELEDIREFASALSELADLLEEIGYNTEEWQGAEGREEKADAREELVSSLQNVQEYVDQLRGLPSLDTILA